MGDSLSAFSKQLKHFLAAIETVIENGVISVGLKMVLYCHLPCFSQSVKGYAIVTRSRTPCPVLPPSCTARTHVICSVTNGALLHAARLLLQMVSAAGRTTAALLDPLAPVSKWVGRESNGVEDWVRDQGPWEVGKGQILAAMAPPWVHLDLSQPR